MALRCHRPGFVFNSEGFFVGDFEGLTATGTRFQSFFVATNTGNSSNRIDVFTTGT